MASIGGVRAVVRVLMFLVTVAMVAGYVIDPPSPVPTTTPGIVYNQSASSAPV